MPLIIIGYSMVGFGTAVVVVKALTVCGIIATK